MQGATPPARGSRLPFGATTEHDRQNLPRQESASRESFDTVNHDLMSPESIVQRIMRTGTVWFGVAVGSSAITLGLLLASGWRPAMLAEGLRVVWWCCFTIVVLSIGLLGWSGCPVLEIDVPTAARNKSLTMQLGTMLFILGSAGAMFVVLLGSPG